jgi:hypothetical protein
MFRHRRFAVVSLAAALAVAGCSTPVLSSLDVSAGPPHTLVMVTGSNLFLSAVLWDGSAIPGGFLGGYMFSVPPGAAPGPHSVTVQNSSGTSNLLTFTVDNTLPLAPPPPMAFEPRIDAVTLLATQFDAAGQVTPILYVQGANFDVGAVARIDGVIAPTIAHKGLRNTLFGVSPSELGYPIYHYVSLVVVAGSRPVGTTLTIEVQNLGSTTWSAPVPYRLPPDAADVDSDGDSLLDSWETNGYDSNGDGILDVDPMAQGVSPARRDILLEVDKAINVGTTAPALGFPPNAATFSAAQAMFATAPIINPTLPYGMHLVIDDSGTAAYSAPVCFDLGPDANACNQTVQAFSSIRAVSFDPGREKLFHYAIWAPEEMLHKSGRSDGSRNFLVSPEVHLPPFTSERSKVEILVHELGHDLNQFHGGGPGDETLYKPNYLSAMTYTWAGRSDQSDAWRQDYATCLPFYYATPGATEVNGKPQVPVKTVVDYSQGMAKDVSRNSGVSKVCGSVVNFTVTGLPSLVSDYANWPNLRFKP